ncbi:MAG: hypothetical protein WC699_15320 [Bacteroidales bacterium]
MKRYWLAVIFFIGFGALFAQEQHILKVFFRYGSIPEIGYEYVEYEEVGGLQGGHVSLGIDSLEIGFTNGKVIHVFPDKNHPEGVYYWEYLKDFEDHVIGKKYITFLVPITDEQYNKLKTLLLDYINNPPYDYAFFGMRCASATYDILSQIGIFKPQTRTLTVISNFYPRLFRRKMTKLAREKGYTVVKVKGRITRIWERD